jgi:hypothetical protein
MVRQPTYLEVLLGEDLGDPTQDANSGRAVQLGERYVI